MVEEHEIGQRIRDARRLRGFSQAALARKAGIDSNTIGGIEIGRRTPRHLTLTRIAGAMDMTVPELWGEDPKAEALEQAESPEARAEKLVRSALVVIAWHLSEWAQETIEADMDSAALLRGLKLIDEVLGKVYGVYNAERIRGAEAAELEGAVGGLAVSFDAMSDALKEAARREADPEKLVNVIELLAPQRRAESMQLALHREEVG